MINFFSNMSNYLNISSEFQEKASLFFTDKGIESLKENSTLLGTAVAALGLSALMYHNNVSKTEKDLSFTTVLSNRIEVFTRRIAKVWNQVINNKTSQIPNFEHVKNTWVPINHEGQDFRLETQADVTSFLKKLRQNNPAITVSQLQYFFKAKALAELDQSSSSVVTSSLDACYQLLKKQFSDTKRPDAFLDIEAEVTREFIFQITDNPVEGCFALDFVNSAVDKYLVNIQDRLDRQPSVTAHPRDLFIEKDLKALSVLLATPNFSRKVSFIHDQVVRKIQIAFLEGYSICQNREAYQTVLCKRAKLDLILHKDIGGVVDLNLLGSNFAYKFAFGAGHLDAPGKLRKLNSVLKGSKLNSVDIDIATLRSFKSEHDSTEIHPDVVIEGAGPTGILSAITQYRAGGDISIYEQRSGEFTRRQIVRLDPKWVEMLRFYLGTKFTEYFEGDHPQGVLHKDGFVEVVTRNLEEMLYTRMTELKSMIEKQGLGATFESVADRKIKDIISPEVSNGPFLAVIGKKDPKDLSEEKRPVDILICAGGKSSLTRDKFLPSYSPVTEEKYYGVCSWGVPGAGRVRSFDTFKDFRGVVKIGLEFRQRFYDKLQSRAWNEAERNLITEIGSFNNASGPLAFLSSGSNNVLERDIFQTRCFENEDTVYIGMELPEELKTIFELIKSAGAGSPREKESAKRLIEGMRLLWFQTIAEEYGLNESLGLGLEHIRLDSAASFPVSQEIPSQPYSLMEEGSSGRKVLIMPAGDSAASPHFMRYSGLTGARENVLHLASYIKDLFNSGRTYDLEKLAEDTKRIQNFVVSRGKVFLKGLSPEKISVNRKVKIKDQLDKECQKPKLPSFEIRKDGERYFVRIPAVRAEDEKVSSLEEKSSLGDELEITITQEGKISLEALGEFSFDSVIHFKNYFGILHN
jgi:hypothetical protein